MIWTIGHSTLAWPRFLALLRAHAIEAVADVRRFPGSRRHPHFARAALEPALAEAGLGYLHLPELGGRRRARPESPNTAWREPSFRGYADHMETAEFAAGAARLVEFAARQRTAVLCAEATWWRCHRGLVADWLRARGHEVLHVAGEARAEPHPWTSAARLVDGRLSYRP